MSDKAKALITRAQLQNYPTSGNLYTIPEISNLILRDTPFLRVFFEDELIPINNCDENMELILLAMPQLAQVTWQFQRTTNEWIPLFRLQDTKYSDAEFIANFCTTQKYETIFG